METNEPKCVKCAELVEATCIENRVNVRRIRTLLEFISNCAFELDRCIDITEVRRVEEAMDSLVHEAWNDPSAIDDCNDALEMFNENKEEDDNGD